MIRFQIWFYKDDRVNDFMQEKRPNGNISCKIKTLEGIIVSNKGDYIIKGVKDEIYPCKEDIFNITYEEVK